jgi:DNA polymerase III delta prime subunit
MNTNILITQIDIEDEYLTKIIKEEYALSSLPKVELFISKKTTQEDIAKLYRYSDEQRHIYIGSLSLFDEAIQDSILKLLEEPPSNTTIYMSARSLSVVKQTILSRCIIKYLDKYKIPNYINIKTNEVIAKYLPKPGEVAVALLNNKPIGLNKIDYKKLEREHIDLWLWKLQLCMESLNTQLPSEVSHNIAHKISAIIKARMYNDSNLQKKFALESICL